MNILKALDLINPGKINIAERVNYYLREKDYDLRHCACTLSSLEVHKKQVLAMKNIINLSDNIVSYMKASQNDLDEFNWEDADNEIYNYVLNLRNQMLKYQKDFGKKNEWIYEAA